MKSAGQLAWWRTRAEVFRLHVGTGALFGFVVLWVILLGLAVGLFAAITSFRASGYLESAWSDAFDGKSALERFPPTERNQSSTRLEKLALEVGVVLARADRDSEESSDAEPNDEAEDSLDDALVEYFHSLISSEETTLLEPPATLLEWLGEHRTQLDRIVELLIEEEPPTEPFELALGFEMRAPNLLAYLRLERRLLLVVIEAMRADDEETATRALEASWHLGAPIWERPSMISQLVAASIAKAQMAVLRRRPGLALGWSPRLRDLDPAGGILTSFRLEAWTPWHDRTIEESTSTPAWMWRWMMLDYARRMHMTVEQMTATDVLEFQPDEFFVEQFGDFPRWNIVGRILFPNLFDAWPRAHRTALDVELTRRLIDACGDPNTTALAERREPSSVDGLSWIFQLDDGVLTILLDGEIDPHRQENRPDLPSYGTVDLDRCRSRLL